MQFRPSPRHPNAARVAARPKPHLQAARPTPQNRITCPTSVPSRKKSRPETAKSRRQPSHRPIRILPLQILAQPPNGARVAARRKPPPQRLKRLRRKPPGRCPRRRSPRRVWLERNMPTCKRRATPPPRRVAPHPNGGHGGAHRKRQPEKARMQRQASPKRPRQQERPKRPPQP